MPISEKIEDTMKKASYIRKMFEEGLRMKKEFGEENVFDLSLGNPILEPPEVIVEALKQSVLDPTPGGHRYMPNAGYAEVRSAIAAHLAAETGQSVQGEDIIMTCGAAGGLNVALKALLDPGDEVVVVAPFFPEYPFYVDNHGGEMVVAESAADFDLDLDAMDRAIGSKTKVVMLNSPNNPTGRMYTASRLAELGELLLAKQRKTGRPITIVSDEPYRKITFDGLEAPDIFAAYPHSILVVSHSKDLGLAGERIGYAAISPGHDDRAMLSAAMTFTNRTLGFVNAPAMFQRLVAAAQSASVPIQIYQDLRDLFCRGLAEAGLEFVKPQGAFYLFPKTPTSDDVEFVGRLQKNNLLAVPGSGFSRAGHIRLCYCVSTREVEGAVRIIKKVMSEL